MIELILGIIIGIILCVFVPAVPTWVHSEIKKIKDKGGN